MHINARLGSIGDTGIAGIDETGYNDIETIDATDSVGIGINGMETISATDGAGTVPYNTKAVGAADGAGTGFYGMNAIGATDGAGIGIIGHHTDVVLSMRRSEVTDGVSASELANVMYDFGTLMNVFKYYDAE